MNGQRVGQVVGATLAALRPSRPRFWAFTFSLLVAGFGLYGLCFTGRLSERLPSDLDWQAAAALLARDARPGDAVALSPFWAERARLVLPSAIPVMAFPRYDTEDLLGVRRVWLLSLPDAPRFSREIEKQLTRRASAVEGPERLGELEVAQFTLSTPMIPRAFFPDRLTGARVALGGRPCARDPSGGFRCDTPPLARVSRQVGEIEFLPRPCIDAAVSAEAPLTVEMRDVPLGTKLRGHTGIGGSPGRRGGPPIRLLVTVDGAELGVAEEPSGVAGWHLFQFDTSPYAGQSRTVGFTVTTGTVQRRSLCFDAMTLP